MARVVGQRMVEKKTITTEQVPVDETAEQSLPDALELSQKLTPEQWEQHIIYIYRVEPRSPHVPGKKAAYVYKGVGAITIDWLAENIGGHQLRVILQKSSGERIADTNYYIEAPPKFRTDYGSAVPAATNASSNPNDLARHAMDMVGDPTKASVGIALQTAQTGFDIVRAQMAANISSQQFSIKDILELMDRRAAQSAGSGMPAWLEQCLAAVVPALISRMLTPENPIKTFTELTAALQNSPMFGGGGKASDDWKASLVQALPMIAQEGTRMMGEWRMAAEAAARAQPRQLPAAPATLGVAMPPQPVTAATGSVTPINIAAAVPAAPNPAVAPGAVPPPPEAWLKMKLVELFRAGQGGADVGQFLEMIAPAFLAEISGVAPEMLQGFLRTDPILGAVADDPRMLPFLTELHTWANDMEPAIADAAAAAVATQQPA